MLRDPVARAYSHWRMEVARNAETLSFSQAIREGRKRIIEEAEILRQHRVYSYVDRGFYTKQIERMLLYFPRRQLLFLTSHHTLVRREAVLDRICDFLEIRRFEDYPANELVFFNQSTDIAAPERADIDYLRNLYLNDILQTQDIIGQQIKLEFP